MPIQGWESDVVVEAIAGACTDVRANSIKLVAGTFRGVKEANEVRSLIS